MDTRVGNQFHLTDSQMTIFRGKGTRLIAALLLALFAMMLSPAQAAVESVAPLSGGDTWNSTWSHLYNHVYPSADAACTEPSNIPPWWHDSYSSYIYLGTTPVINPKASNLPEGTLTCLFRITTSYTYDTGFGGAYPWPYPTCPVPMVNPAIPYVYNASTNMCERTLPDATCPIPKFPDINDSDACTKSLEKGKGKDIDGVCDELDPEIVKQERCLAKKIRDLGISYTEPSATVRTVAYQQHFVDLWEWHEVKIPKAREDWTDAEKQACAPMVAKVEAEWGKHKIKGAPSKSGPDAPHVMRNAVDIDEGIVEAMKAAVNKSTFLVPFPSYCFLCLPEYPVYIGDVQDYVNNPLVNPPACKLRWGGRFRKYDGVHFDLLLK